MNERTHSEDGVSRRQTLTAVTGATVAGLAGVPTAVVGDSGREKRITTLATGSQSQETVTVSKRWYRHKERAIRVKEALSRRHLGEGSIHSVGIETDDRSVGGLRGKRVRVAAAPDGDVSALDAVPSAVEGIPVRTVEAERPRKTDCYNGASEDVDGDLDDEFLGGMAFEGLENVESDPSTVGSGTLCCRVYYNNTRYMLACRHTISGNVCDTPGITGDSYGWGRTGDDNKAGYDGDVGAAFSEYDAALLTLRIPRADDISDRIVDEPNARVVGRVTGDGIDVLQSEPAGTVYKRGRQTCGESGEILAARLTYNTDCLDPRDPQKEYGQVRTSATQEKGDSGGPVYIRRNDSSGPDDIFVLNMATRNYSPDGESALYAQGSSADIMHREQGFSFGYNPFY